MRKILLDTNFIVACIKQKIDFLTELEEYDLIVPNEVIGELKKLKKDKKTKIRDRQAAEVAVQMFKMCKLNQIDLRLGKDKNIDNAIADYINKKGIILASLDRKLRKKINNKRTKFLVIKQKKKLGFI